VRFEITYNFTLFLLRQHLSHIPCSNYSACSFPTHYPLQLPLLVSIIISYCYTCKSFLQQRNELNENGLSFSGE
jgi:hypothetical protein